MIILHFDTHLAVSQQYFVSDVELEGPASPQGGLDLDVDVRAERSLM